MVANYDRVKRARRHQEEALDDALKNTFPASDPVSIAVSTGPTVILTRKSLESGLPISTPCPKEVPAAPKADIC